jgi:aminopeptidase N
MERLSVIARAALAASVLLASYQAQSIAQRAGDTTVSGAEECAAAKSAMVSRIATASVASANFDATYYGLDLDLDFDTPSIRAAVRVEGRVVGSPMSTLVLDFSDEMQVDSVRTAAGEVVGVTHSGDALSLGLPSAIPAGGSVAVDVYYHGLPTPGDGVFEFGELGGVTFAWSYSEPYGARRWFPCKDHPTDKADSVMVRVTVPDSLEVGAPGVLRSLTSAAGRATYEWVETHPIATYLVSVAAGEYVHYDDTYTRPTSLVGPLGPLSLPLVHLVYDDGTSSLPAGWSRVGTAMEVFESWFGAYPFADEKYGHAEVTFGGAMEHQTLSSMGSRTTNVVVHELAHQWFGDMITPRSWVDLWLNEGFATYSELVYWEARDADAPGTYAQLVRNTMRNATHAPGTLVLEDTTSVSDMFNPTRVYAKGGIVLHMLRAVVGDAEFHDIVAQYAADPDVRFGNGNATTADFVAIAEAVHGASLGWFFDEWVTNGTGYPDYRVLAELKQSGDYKAFVTVEQLQQPPASNVDVFVMPLTIAVETTSGEERFTVQNDARHQVFELDVTGMPKGVVFDPDFQVLRDVDLEPEAEIIARTPVFKTMFPNPTGQSTLLRFTLPDDRPVEIAIFDVAGRYVRTVDRVHGAGPHDLSIDVRSLASGVYFVQLDGAAGTERRKLVVLR